jgi:hypothetical protein
MSDRLIEMLVAAKFELSSVEPLLGGSILDEVHEMGPVMDGITGDY